MIARSVRRTQTRLILLFTLVTSASMLPFAAFGMDRWAYPGSQCVRWKGPLQPGLTSSTMFNPSTDEDLSVDCPVIIWSETWPKAVWIDVIDSHTDRDVECSFVYRNYTETGIDGYSTPRKQSSGFSSFVQRLKFDAELEGKPGLPRGHAFFSCKIPPRDDSEVSGIVKYVVENDPVLGTGKIPDPVADIPR